jgi:hypothetical protein
VALASQVAAVGLALVFLVAGVAKLRSPVDTRRALGDLEGVEKEQDYIENGGVK